MDNVIEVIKQLDIFSHGQFLRYRGEENYRTITGGIVSVVLMVLFAGIFSTLVLNTFQKNLITTTFEMSYEVDPSYYKLQTGSKSNFMFAIGILNLDLSSSKKYFDIELSSNKLDKTIVNNTVERISNKTILTLQPCTIGPWKAINSDIERSFNNSQLTTWLCSLQNQIIHLQGKYTSDTFRYSRLSIKTCSPSSSSNSTCANQTEISSFIDSNDGYLTVQLYYVNTVINAGSQNYLNYYFEDKNILMVNLNQGAEANYYFTQYSVETDQSILPIVNSHKDEGVYVDSQVIPSFYPISSSSSTKTIAQIFFRKAPDVYTITRSFQKLDDTLSYIGGLFGIIVLFFLFFSIYDKFAYQIEMGDRMFKRNQQGTYGSQNFNFIVYLGYGFYYVLSLFGINLNWKSMKKYHECRIQSKKQLDVHLLFKKITFLQQVAKLVLQDHHIRGLNLIPKPTLKQIRQARKHHQIQSIIYHQLQRKGRDVFIEQEEYRKHFNHFMNDIPFSDNAKEISIEDHEKNSQSEKQNHQFYDISKNYKILQLERENGDKYSKKILEKLDMKDICNAILRLTIGDLKKPEKVQKTQEKIIDDTPKSMMQDIQKVQGSKNIMENIMFITRKQKDKKDNSSKSSKQ